jgi:hypothetical protein
VRPIYFTVELYEDGDLIDTFQALATTAAKAAIEAAKEHQRQDGFFAKDLIEVDKPILAKVFTTGGPPQPCGTFRLRAHIAYEFTAMETT